jgi:ATP-dependent DNA helicase RecG
VGPARADLLKKELQIFTFKDLLEHFPLRHIDKTKVSLIADVKTETDFIQVSGTLINMSVIGDKRARRLIATLTDKSGELELVWFNSIQWIQKSLKTGNRYLVFGRTSFFQGYPQIMHPEIEPLRDEISEGRNYLEPVYPSTEKLKSKGLGGRQIAKLTATLFSLLTEKNIPEILPDSIIGQLKLINRFSAFQNIHFPANADVYTKSLDRLKFEEFFIAQLRAGLIRSKRHHYSQGIIFDHVGD